MDALAWTAVGVIVAILVAVVGTVSRLLDRINTAKEKAGKAEARADAAAITAAATNIRVDALERELNEHRVSSAREYVSKETLREVQSAVVDAINHLGDRLDKFLVARSQ